jgi:hypothetical protein
LKEKDFCAEWVSGDSMIWKARNFGDRELFQTAQNIKMPACDKLQTLKNYG